ncbi:TPR Domain containing protein, partial [Metarhizium hybridum]
MASPHAIMCESFFNLDKEIIVYLNGCHDSDLLSMEKLHEKLEIFEGMRLHIITCLLLYLRTGATVHAEKALHRARHLNTMAGPGDKDEAGKILETAVIMKDNGRNLVQSLTLNEIRRQLKTRLEESGLLTAPAPGVYAACQCFQSTPQDGSTWVPSLLGLAGVFKKRFEQSTPRDIRDLTLAINLTLVGLRATPENDGLYRSKRLQSLSELLFARFRHTRSRDDLDRTIQLREQALVLTSSTDTDWVVQAYNLGNCYGERFDMNGHIDGLNRCIMLLEAAARRQDMQLEGDILCNLAFRLVRRSDRTGSMDDLNSAVAAGERSTNLSVQGHDRTERIECLAACLSKRFERAGSMRDLDRAVQLLRNAVSLMPADYPHRGQTLNNLGATLGLKHGVTKSAADLDDAIEATGKALEALPSDHPSRVLALSNLSVFLKRRACEATCNVQSRCPVRQ